MRGCLGNPIVPNAGNVNGSPGIIFYGFYFINSCGFEYMGCSADHCPHSSVTLMDIDNSHICHSETRSSQG